jgi:hypothetical protein
MHSEKVMETLVLIVQLHTGGPVVRVPVSDCAVGAVWLREAREWAKRSGIDEVGGPVYVCGPAEVIVMQVKR